jgi:hypothetical protein
MWGIDKGTAEIDWNHRPIEDALRAELELSRKIADEAIKQTEILTEQLKEKEKEITDAQLHWTRADNEMTRYSSEVYTLRKQLDESNRKLEQRIAMEIDEHLKVVELQNQMDIAWEGLDDIIVMELPDEIHEFAKEPQFCIEETSLHFRGNSLEEFWNWQFLGASLLAFTTLFALRGSSRGSPQTANASDIKQFSPVGIPIHMHIIVRLKASGNIYARRTRHTVTAASTTRLHQ